VGSGFVVRPDAIEVHLHEPLVGQRTRLHRGLHIGDARRQQVESAWLSDGAKTAALHQRDETDKVGRADPCGGVQRVVPE
jgi:hypothetical protein